MNDWQTESRGIKGGGQGWGQKLKHATGTNMTSAGSIGDSSEVNLGSG
jgi:hypothetical protein